MRTSGVLLLLGLLAAAPAWAQGSVGDGQQLVPGWSRGTGSPKGQPVGGMLPTDTTFRLLRINSDGTLSATVANPPYFHWAYLPTGVQTADIPARGFYKAVSVNTIPDFKETYSIWYWTVADTDTVAMEVWQVCKKASDVADGVDGVIDEVDTLTTGAGNWSNETNGIAIFNTKGYAAYNAYASPRRVFVGGGTPPTATTIPRGLAGSISVATTSVAFKASCPCGYLTWWVRNYKATVMDDVSGDLWVKY